MKPVMCYLAIAPANLPGDGSVQIFPPGKQTVTPSRADGAAPAEITLTIDAGTAQALEACRADFQAKADAGEGDAPYIDFNHDDREAAGWVKRIYWAGDDPLKGGVRAEVEWSAAGDAAVKGKTYRRFSPMFFAANGLVTGAPVNMGGLVNRAAFTRIAPLFAKGTEPEPESHNTMNEDQIKALQTENEDLKAKLVALQKQLEELNKSDAEATVAQAAKEGRIAAAPEVQTKWVAAILRDPAAKDLLKAMAPNPALVSAAVKDKPADDEAAPDKLLAKYSGMTDRDERAAFYAKHKDALRQAHDRSIR